MTLLVALKGRDGLVLAADSRGTFGDPRNVTAQNDTMIKATVLSGHSSVLIAGSSEVGALIVSDFLDTIARGVQDDPAVMMNALREHARLRYSEWFPSIPPVPPIALLQSGQVAARPDLTFVLGGIDPETGEASIYQLGSGTDFSPMLHNYGFAVAGVPQYALYLLNRLYESDRDVEELTALAVYAITETASQDGKVGGPVRVITINQSDGCRQLSADDVQSIVRENHGRSEDLRRSFYHPQEEE